MLFGSLTAHPSQFNFVRIGFCVLLFLHLTGTLCRQEQHVGLPENQEKQQAGHAIQPNAGFKSQERTNEGFGLSEEPERVRSNNLLEDVLRGVERALYFYENNSNQLNLDAVIGTRILEGILYGIVDRDSVNRQIPAPLLQRLIRIYHRSQHVSETTSNHVKQNTPKYYKKVHNIIQDLFWNRFYPLKPLKRPLSPFPINSWQHCKSFFSYKNQLIQESFSDSCISQFFSNKDHARCSISDECVVVMTTDTENVTGYGLTHQAFYLEIAEQAGCSGKIIEKFVQNQLPSYSTQLPLKKISTTAKNMSLIERLENDICFKVLQEMKDIDKDLYSRDLLIEQVSLCGYFGFVDFLQTDLLLNMLTQWQSASSGCFNLLGKEPTLYREQVRAHVSAPFYGHQKRGQVVVSRQASAGIGHGGGRISKRVEQVVRTGTDGELCSSHTTSVAISAYAVFLRALLDPYLVGMPASRRPDLWNQF